VYFDGPDPNGNGISEDVAVPMTDTQLSALPPGLHVEKRLTGLYTLPAAARSNAIARPRLHLSITGPQAVHGGQRATYRITLSLSQPTNRVVYALKNVQVGATHARHRLRHWVVPTPPPRGRSRALDLTLAVPSTARESFSVTATASAKHAQGTRAQFCATISRRLPVGLG